MNPFRFLHLISAANEGDEISIANALGGEAIFEVQQDGRWFVPYGRHPHAKGLQIFDRASAEIMMSVFNSLGAKIGRFFNRAAVPIYLGHPDVPGRADSNPAAPAMGWIEGIEVQNDGAYFVVALNDDGDHAIRNKHFRFYSPHWNCRPVKGGIQPVQLLSIGLTNNPRIPVPAIANDQLSDSMKLTDLLRKLLGIAAENDAPSEAQIDEAAAAVELRIATLTTAENDARTALATVQTAHDALQGQLITAQNDVTTITAARDALQTQLTAANDRATAERAARVDVSLDRFAASGHVTPAERTALRTELIALENDALTTRLEEIGKAKPKLNTQGVGDIGKARKAFAAANDETLRGEQRKEAIAAEQLAIANDRTCAGLSDGARYDRAFNRARIKHPDLFKSQTTTA